MKGSLFLVLAGTIALGFQTTSVAFAVPSGLKPDLMMVVVVWAAGRISLGIGAPFAFLAGMMMDLFSGSPSGLFAVFYCLIFVCAVYAHANLSIQEYAGPVILVFCASLAAGATVVLAARVSGPVGFGWTAAGWIVLKSLITAVAALPAFGLIEWAWRAAFAEGIIK
jgi:rod shape-determining protein MreD